MTHRLGWFAAALRAAAFVLAFAGRQAPHAMAGSRTAPLADSAGSLRASAAVTGSLYLPAIAGGAGAAATPSAPPTATAAPPTATAVPTPAAYTIAGYVQKGPFVQGASITVRELDNSFTPTGRTFTGSIDDNTGRFSVRGTLAYPYVELEANGYYFNEVTGSPPSANSASCQSPICASAALSTSIHSPIWNDRVCSVWWMMA